MSNITSLLILLVGCPKPPTPPTPPIYSCLADPIWYNDPRPPNEVATTESFCDFYQFGWQWFLAQTSPSLSKPSERVFELNRVYDPSIEFNQCSLNLSGKQDFIISLEPRTIKSDEFEHVEADGGALYDQNGNILYYGINYSDTMCNATSKGFVPGTLEIKTAWIVLEKNDSSYYSIALDDGIRLGMVGMHMAIWTPNHPEMIWLTWEHKKNAPNCNGSSPIQKWNFASKEASACLSRRTNEGDCAEYKFNTPLNFEDKPPLKSDPTEVCREFPYGNQFDHSVNGNNNTENINVILELNEQLVGDRGLLTLLANDDPMRVWSNYEMIGGLWTKDGANSGQLPINSQQGPADSNSPQRGSLELTNMSMETFQQGESSYVPNCFGCHNYNSETPLSVSHIQQHL